MVNRRYKDSGIGRSADFDHAEAAVREAFRWYCCERHADQKACEPACPRKQALDGLARGRDLLLALCEPAPERKAGEAGGGRKS